ncbi:type II toxin-antitoxin system VapC family toxin [Paenibacillus alkaliterrae]|uniref:type II toxin-antitoxin system VapC family toxin n=1 Tax=Paenibacillus alkaliterrae TaxID=320909 RepID=UPI001F1E4A00|nr:type II toxin-antitoxin system VapC family toxin [Paenibacillus alkaliterrae]MCF2941028.1 type II toxin-antitoxin system VapC family toxin [Paenibacillus alkaliterrae]
MHKNKVVIDTNIWLYVIAGIPSAVRYLTQLIEQQETEILYSAVTYIEIYSYPNLDSEKRRVFEQLLSLGKLVELDERISRVAADLRAARKKVTGKNLKIADACVAATSLVQNAMLITNDIDDFKNIEELKCLNPIVPTELHS